MVLGVLIPIIVAGYFSQKSNFLSTFNKQNKVSTKAQSTQIEQNLSKEEFIDQELAEIEKLLEESDFNISEEDLSEDNLFR